MALAVLYLAGVGLALAATTVTAVLIARVLEHDKGVLLGLAALLMVVGRVFELLL